MTSDTLDVRGKTCPTPLLLTKRKLESMSDGELLQVVVDHPQTRENILKLVERTRNEILGVEQAKGGLKITIRKRTISQSEGDFKKKDLSCPSSS